MKKKLLTTLTSILFFSNCFIQSSFAEKIPTDEEETLSLAIWSIIPAFMHLSLLASENHGPKFGITSEYLVMRDKSLDHKVDFIWGVETQSTGMAVKTSYPFLNGKPSGIIQDMGVKLPLYEERNNTYFVGGYLSSGISLGRYNKELAWGGYAGIGGVLNLDKIVLDLGINYRNLNSSGLINSFTLSGNLSYKI